MTKKIIIFYVIFGLMLIITPVLAKPNFVAVNVITANRTVTVPQQAVEVSLALYYLGEAVDPASGRQVEGYAIIRYKENYVKPPWAGGGGGATKCYAFLANNAKWKAIEPWLINPENNSLLDNNIIFSNLSADITKWEDAGDGLLNNNIVQILGDGSSVNYGLSADFTAPDGQNEVYFADVQSSGAIAITVVWGIFSGPPSQRELLEWDQVFDDVDYDWSLSGEADKMDFENIATHELGHSVGLADLYTSSCNQETMYGYADYGEIIKRTLEAGDIAGANQLY